MDRYVTPMFGKLPIQMVDTALVLKVLEPIWVHKPVTASRLRGQIEAVLDWAKTQGSRDGDNPARWRGHLENALPARAKLRKVEHRPALPFDQTADFMQELRNRSNQAAPVLEFCILTAARTGEVIDARWSEIDRVARVWTVPAPRMKSGRDHRVPLSDAAMTILRKMDAARRNEFVFPGRDQPQIGSDALLKLVEKMGRRDITVHGFRSTFRDWVSECTDFPRELAEAALAHVVGDKVEVAYRRGDALEKRRRLMQAWADYCAGVEASGVVVPLRAS